MMSNGNNNNTSQSLYVFSSSDDDENDARSASSASSDFAVTLLKNENDRLRQLNETLEKKRLQEAERLKQVEREKSDILKFGVYCGNIENYLNEQKLSIVNRNTDPRNCTHTGMDNKRLHVEDNQEIGFLHTLAFSVTHSVGYNKFCEILDPYMFRFFADCDLKLMKPMDKNFVLTYSRTYQDVMRMFFPNGNHRLIVCTTAPEEIKATEGCAIPYFKSGIHWIWPEVIVNLALALVIANRAKREFEKRFPATLYPYPCNTVVDQIDLAPYKNKGGGLRMIYNAKMSKCTSCKNKEDKRTQCITCHGNGSIEIGRLYTPTMVLNDDGTENNEEAKRLLNRDYCWYAFAYTCIRVPRIPCAHWYVWEWNEDNSAAIFRQTTVTFLHRLDFVEPADLPNIEMNQHEATASGLKLSLYEERAHVTLIEKSSSDINTNEDPAHPAIPIDYLALSLAQQTRPVEKKVIIENRIEVAPQPRTIVICDVNKCNGRDAAKIAQRYKELSSVATLGTNAETLDRYIREGKCLETIHFNNRKLMQSLSMYLGSLVPQHKGVNISSILTNHQSKVRFFLLFPNNRPGQYCPNKLDYHTTSFVYWYVSENGSVTQRCTSRKGEIRPGHNVSCPMYEPRETTERLPDDILDVLIGQNNSSRELEKFSYDERVHLQNAQSNIIDVFQNNVQPTNPVFIHKKATEFRDGAVVSYTSSKNLGIAADHRNEISMNMKEAIKQVKEWKAANGHNNGDIQIPVVKNGKISIQQPYSNIIGKPKPKKLANNRF